MQMLVGLNSDEQNSATIPWDNYDRGSFAIAVRIEILEELIKKLKACVWAVSTDERKATHRFLILSVQTRHLYRVSKIGQAV